MTITTRSVVVSETGHVREHNEDAVFADDELGLWLVADGMGGHASGEVASRMAVEGISRAMRQGSTLEEAMQTLHRDIITAGENNPAQQGMGCTIVALQRQKLGFQIAWAGDSRIYVAEEGEGLRQLSIDHSLAQELVLRGAISAEEVERSAKKTPISQALGMTNLERLHVGQVQVRPARKGLFLLCSDGVSDMLAKDVMAGILGDPSQLLEELARKLGDAVNATDATDNYSFVLLQYQPDAMVRGLNGFMNRIPV